MPRWRGGGGGGERRARAASLRRTDADLAEGWGSLDPEAIALVRSQAWPDVRDADELHDFLLTVGGLPLQDAGPGQAGAGGCGGVAARGAGRGGLVGGCGGNASGIGGSGATPDGPGGPRVTLARSAHRRPPRGGGLSSGARGGPH